jgi:hypothetical protein
MTTSYKPTNPYSLDGTLEQLRHYLAAVNRTDALELLETAITKAEEDEIYAQRMESALLCGSTVEYRSLFSDFGDYWAKTRNVFPYYPHHDNVNLIDSAMHHIKRGCVEEAIEFYNGMHNQR